MRDSPFVRLPAELRNKIYSQIDLNERETFGQHTHGKLVDFPHPLAATCRRFYHEMAGLPYTLSDPQQFRLETEQEEWIPKVEVVRILTRKVPIAWEPQLRFRWRQMLQRIRNVKRTHFCVLLEPLMVAPWLKGSDKPAWESRMRAQVAFILPHVEEVFEWEFAGPVKRPKAWADVAQTVGPNKSNNVLQTLVEKLGRLNI